MTTYLYTTGLRINFQDFQLLITRNTYAEMQEQCFICTQILPDCSVNTFACDEELLEDLYGIDKHKLAGLSWIVLGL